MTTKREIHSEMLEPFFGSLLSTVTMNVVAAAGENGVYSVEFAREEYNFKSAIEGMKKIALAAESAVHARMALYNEIGRAEQAIEKMKGKLG